MPPGASKTGPSCGRKVNVYSGALADEGRLEESSIQRCYVSKVKHVVAGKGYIRLGCVQRI